MAISAVDLTLARLLGLDSFVLWHVYLAGLVAIHMNWALHPGREIASVSTGVACAELVCLSVFAAWGSSSVPPEGLTFLALAVLVTLFVGMPIGLFAFLVLHATAVWLSRMNRSLSNAAPRDRESADTLRQAPGQSLEKAAPPIDSADKH